MISDVGSVASPSPAIPGNPGGQLGKEEFLKMLVAQLQNQDPLNPMKGDDMAAQLAHFSSLEQLTNISGLLEAQGAQQEGIIASINDTTAMNVLGKTVLAVGDQLHLEEAGGGSVRFEVGGAGGLGTLRILDESGRELGSRPLGFVAAGRHEFEIGDAAAGLPPGKYRYAVDVADSAGKVAPTQPFISARIDGVRYGAEGPVLTAGPLRIAFGTILQITTD